MSDAKGQQHEPSMEEILASIRRIIAEDGETAAEPAAAAAAAPEAAPTAAEPAEDILELTDVVEPDGSVVSLNAAPKVDPAPPPPLVPPPLREVAPAAEPADAEGIVSAATAAASVAA